MTIIQLLKNQASELLILFFLIITFLQSGIDKVTNWKENISFINKHFSKTIFVNYVPFLLSIILVLELLSGAFMFVGFFKLLITQNNEIALQGIQLSALCLILLLIGQRVTKDYNGEMVIAVCFIITLFGMLILT